MDMYPKGKTETDFEVERDRLHLQMISAVSHDLKTPLASVIGSLEIYNKMKHILSDEKKDTLINTAIQEAYRLDGFISNILDMAKLDNGMVKVNLGQYHVPQILRETLQKMDDHIGNAQIDILESETPDDCLTDVVLLSRSLQCLLDNALKYAGPNARIRISSEVEGDILRIRVLDNGPGIPEEDREKVFDKYTRLSRKDYQNASTGLGLTLCRAMITLLKGRVYLTQGDDKELSGACAVIEIPYRPV